MHLQRKNNKTKIKTPFRVLVALETAKAEQSNKELQLYYYYNIICKAVKTIFTERIYK